MSDPMTPEELDAIDARLEAATPGPWIRSPLPGTSIQSVDVADDVIAFVQTGKSHEVVSNQAVADADLIAHAPEDLRRLRAEVERLRAHPLTRADVEAALGRADHERVLRMFGLLKTLAQDGGSLTAGSRRGPLVDLVCAVLGITEGGTHA